MTHQRQELGRFGESAAAKEYEALGFDVVDRNYRYGRDEIDIICVRDKLVVFVEVKTRTSNRYGSGVVAVGYRKQAKIKGVALAWLGEQGWGFDEIRFDVAEVNPEGWVELWETAF